MTRMTTRLAAPATTALVVASLAAMSLAACGDDDTTDETSADETAAAPTDADADNEADDDAVDTTGDTRVVALGEEFLLANLLALDVPVVASTSNTPGEGFPGITREDTSDITALSSTELDLEEVLAADPTLLVADDFAVDAVGLDTLEQIAPVQVVASGDWREAFTALGAELDREAEAQAVLAEYDAAVAEAREALADPPLTSVATVYPGESLAVWVGGEAPITQALADLEVPLAPSAEDVDADGNGRAFVSTELATELLTGDVLLLLQSETVEGESEALDTVVQGDLFAMLPAVRANRVEILDRLGYPGVPGRIDAVEDVAAALGQ